MSEFSVHDLYQIRAFRAHRAVVQFDAISGSPNWYDPYCVSVLSLTGFVDPAYFCMGQHGMFQPSCCRRVNCEHDLSSSGCA